MEYFLSDEKKAWKYLDKVPGSSFAKIGVYRPQLLFFGYYKDEETGITHKSFDKNISKDILNNWFDSLKNDFELIMIMEYYDISLAMGGK